MNAVTMSTETSSPSTSLIEAIENKYSDDNDGLMSIQIFVPKSAPGQKETGEIIVPTELSLDNANITHAGEENKVTSLCSGVTLLDLSENKLADWEEVFKILKAVPLCSFLNLKSNPLNHQINRVEHMKVYPNLVKLVLNDVLLPWSLVTQLLGVLPKIHELHLSKNKYICVELPEDQTYPQLLILHLSDNKIEQWEEISKLGKVFPNLETLILLQNPLYQLPSSEEMLQPFNNLKTISISKTKIPDWEQLQKFRYFPNLTHIRLQGLTFLEEYPEDLRRQLVLAYLPNVTRLNGGKVAEGERDTAERVMIRHYMDKEGPLPDRYHELEAIHGKLDRLVDVDFSAQNMWHVTVTIHCKGKSFLQNVNVNWTKNDLVKKLEPIVGMKGSDMMMWHTESIGLKFIKQMTYPTRTLQRYSFQDGDEIHIEEKIKIKRNTRSTPKISHQ